MKKKGASNIKVSVILSYLLVVSVMITGLIALYNNLVDFSNKKVRNEDTSELIIVGNILSMLYEVESEQDLLTSEGAEQYYAKYDSLIPAVKKNLERLKEYTDDEIRKNKLDSISLLMKIKSENLLDISSLLDSISKSPNIIRETDSRYVPKELNRDISDYLEKINISNPNIARSDTIIITGERKSFINRVRDVFNAKQDSTIVIENKTLVPDVEFRLIVDTIINKVIYSERLDLRRQREIHTDLIRRQEVMSQTNRMLTSQIDELLKNIEHEEIKKSLLLISERSRAISRSQNTMFVVSLLSIIFAIIFAVLFLIDINKSHRYRMQLEQSNKRITDLLSYREMLMLTISHDIKAPTGSILGYIDLMIEEKDNKKSNFYLQNIKLSAIYMIIKQLYSILFI
jgi:two-component system sensor histidine kinase EvgS